MSKSVRPPRVYQFSGAGIQLNLSFLTPPSQPTSTSFPAQPPTLPGTFNPPMANLTRSKSISTRVRKSASTRAISLSFPHAFALTAKRSFALVPASKACWKNPATTCVSTGAIFTRSLPTAVGTSQVLSTRPKHSKLLWQLDVYPKMTIYEHSNPTLSRLRCSLMLSRSGFRSKPVSRYLSFSPMMTNFPIEYLNRRLRPYWRRNGDGAAELLSCALRDYEKLQERLPASTNL